MLTLPVAWVISSDGLALTNYHVVKQASRDGVKELLAMTYDGKAHRVEEVLSADAAADVALVQLGGEGPFYPAPIARQAPPPLTPVHLLSHPRGQYFVYTHGRVESLCSTSSVARSCLDGNHRSIWRGK